MRSTVGKRSFGSGAAHSPEDQPRLHQPPRVPSQDNGSASPSPSPAHRLGSSPRASDVSAEAPEEAGTMPSSFGSSPSPPSAAQAIAGLASPGDYASDSFDDSSFGAAGTPSPSKSKRGRGAGSGSELLPR